jgi:hypothetical protein
VKGMSVMIEDGTVVDFETKEKVGGELQRDYIDSIERSDKRKVVQGWLPDNTILRCGRELKERHNRR